MGSLHDHGAQHRIGLRQLVAAHRIVLGLGDDGLHRKPQAPLGLVQVGAGLPDHEGAHRLGPARVREAQHRRTGQPRPPARTMTESTQPTALNLLVVDDDADMLRLLTMRLTAAGYRVTAVTSAEAALTQLQLERPQLVLSDVRLPGKDGLEVLGSIRAKDNPVPLLIITARDGLEDRLRGLDGGADDYVLKPFEMAELLARMRAVLRRKGGSATPVLSSCRMVWRSRVVLPQPDGPISTPIWPARRPRVTPRTAGCA